MELIASHYSMRGNMYKILGFCETVAMLFPSKSLKNKKGPKSQFSILGLNIIQEKENKIDFRGPLSFKYQE